MKFGYTIIYVEDVAASLDFFKLAFGIPRKFVHESGAYGELDTGETVLAFAANDVGNMNLPNGFTKLTEVDPPAGIEIALVTDDVDAAVKKSINAGAVLLAEAQAKPWGQIVAYVGTPDGILVELCAPVSS